MDLGLAGRRAFITRGSHGIGLAIARALASEDAEIVVCGRDTDSLTRSRMRAVQQMSTTRPSLAARLIRSLSSSAGLTCWWPTSAARRAGDCWTPAGGLERYLRGERAARRARDPLRGTAL